MTTTATHHHWSRRQARRLATAAALVATLALPLTVSAGGPIERIVIREHKLEFSDVVTDDVCGDVAGGEGLRSGTFYLTQTGHTTIWVYPDRFHVFDIENGTYSYDFDDPSIPDVEGRRYSIPFSYVATKSGNENVMENQVEFKPGDPDAIRIRFRLSLHWRDGVPQVEREFFEVTGCP